MILGLDEVGRGCWAGPLVAGAVLLPVSIPGLDDSKKLSKKRRGELAQIIHDQAVVGLGWVSPREVDTLGLTESVRLAMQRAVLEIKADFTEVIIDGNFNFLPNLPNSRAEIKADGNVPEVSAASIVAKVARDKYMAELPGNYAAWEFASHVGYGTKRHSDLLRLHGVSDIHRLSYRPVQQLL